MLRPILPILLSSSLLAADAPKSGADAAPDHNDMGSALRLMPNGSVLKNVMLPRYDQARKLNTILRADQMTIIDEVSMKGKHVRIEFYDATAPDNGPKTKVNMKFARFNQDKGEKGTELENSVVTKLESDDPVEIFNAAFEAHGTGLRYFYHDGPDPNPKPPPPGKTLPPPGPPEQTQGFLVGPVESRFYQKVKATIPAKTSMNFPITPRGAATALATAMFAVPAFADAPPPLTEEALDKIQEESATMVPAATATLPDIRKKLAETEKASSDASGVATEFLKKAGIATLALETAPNPTVPEAANDSPKVLPVPRPLDVKPGPGDTIVNCSGGMFFDKEKNILVYMKDVVVHDPRFDMTGADELKVFFTPKAPKPGPSGDKQEDGKPAPASSDSRKNDPSDNDSFGDVDHVVATGAVHFIQKPVKKPDDKPSADKKEPEPVEASGGVLVFYPKTGEKIIHGRYPWVKKGDSYMRANEENLYLHIQKDGSFTTQGNWTQFMPLKQGDDSKKDKGKAAQSPKPATDNKPKPAKPGSETKPKPAPGH